MSESKNKEQDFQYKLGNDKEEKKLLFQKIDSLELKNEELNELLQVGENKYQKLKLKFEEEKKKIFEDSESLLKEKKLKLKIFKE